jgi:hypothetical protein
LFIRTIINNIYFPSLPSYLSVDVLFCNLYSISCYVVGSLAIGFLLLAAATAWDLGECATSIRVTDDQVTLTCAFERDDFFCGFLDLALKLLLVLLELGVADGLEGVTA